MYDQILQLVKEHIGNDPQIAAIPQEQQDAVHHEIAQHVTNGLQSQAAQSGGLLSMLQGAMASGGTMTSAIEGGLVGSLASKFGLPPMITGAIAGALPGLLQRFVQKANDPNDHNITADNISKSFSDIGGMFNR